MSSSEKQKETPVQRPDDDKRTKSAKARRMSHKRKSHIGGS